MSAGRTVGLAQARLAFPELRARSLAEALREMAENLAAAGTVRDPVDLALRLARREREGCTSVVEGIAFPHCRLEELSEIILAVGVSRAGIDFGAAGGVPVTLLFLVLSPRDAPGQHLQALAEVSHLARIPGLPDRLRGAGSADAILEILEEVQAAGSRPPAA